MLRRGMLSEKLDKILRLFVHVKAMLLRCTFTHLRGIIALPLAIVGILLTSLNSWSVDVKARARPVVKVVSVKAGLNESVNSMKVVTRVGTSRGPVLV